MLTRAAKERMAQRETPEQRYERIGKQMPPPSLHKGRFGGGRFGGSVEKSEPYRDAALLDMARGRRCLLLAVEGCRGASGDTTVAAHSNLGIHGKAKGRKADDCYSVWACHACHSWLDQSGSPKAEKERAFMAAHLRQVLAWRAIAVTPSESERNRAAALAALDRLSATRIAKGFE